MLRVTIELLPRGSEKNTRTLAIAEIENDLTGTLTHGNYQYKLWGELDGKNFMSECKGKQDCKEQQVMLIPLMMRVPNEHFIYAPSRYEHIKIISKDEFFNGGFVGTLMLVSLELDGVSEPRLVMGWGQGLSWYMLGARVDEVDLWKKAKNDRYTN